MRSVGWVYDAGKKIGRRAHFAWIDRNRWLGTDAEAKIASATALLYAATAMALIRRIAPSEWVSGPGGKA